MKISSSFFFFIFFLFCSKHRLLVHVRGGSNEYPKSLFWSKNKTNRYTPANPSFFYVKAGYRWVYITGHVILMLNDALSSAVFALCMLDKGSPMGGLFIRNAGFSYLGCLMGFSFIVYIFYFFPIPDHCMTTR